MPPEVVPYVNLALNLVALVVVVALAVWLRRSHISNVQLRAQLLGMVLALRLTINGKNADGSDAHEPSDPDTG